MSTDQEFAEQLDKEMNATLQRRSTPHKKAIPQKKSPIKPAALKQQVLNLAMKQEVLNSDVKDFLKTELISAVQNTMESLVNIVKAVITKDFCHAADLLARKEGQAALEKLNKFGNILLCEHLEIKNSSRVLHQLLLSPPQMKWHIRHFILHTPLWITPQYGEIPNKITRT